MSSGHLACLLKARPGSSSVSCSRADSEVMHLAAGWGRVLIQGSDAARCHVPSSQVCLCLVLPTMFHQPTCHVIAELTHCSCSNKYGLSKTDPFSIMQVPMLKSTQQSGWQTTPPRQPLKDGLDVAISMCSSLDDFNECVCPLGSRPMALRVRLLQSKHLQQS